MAEVNSINDVIKNITMLNVDGEVKAILIVAVINEGDINISHHSQVKDLNSLFVGTNIAADNLLEFIKSGGKAVPIRE